jgi:hypothetical protein
MKLCFFISIFLTFSVATKAQFDFGQDTALLVELVTTTASQLNELEKLVTNAEKYTKKMQEYNELFQDEYFRAERVMYLAESIAAKKEINDLGTLNDAIRELKYSLADLKEMMREYAVIKQEEDRTKAQVKIEKRMADKRGVQAQKQVEKAINAKTVGRASQITAQNTALILESQVDLQRTQLQMLEKQATTNRLLAEQMEEKRLEQIKREQTYKADQKRGRL